MKITKTEAPLPPELTPATDDAAAWAELFDRRHRKRKSNAERDRERIAGSRARATTRTVSDR